MTKKSETKTAATPTRAEDRAPDVAIPAGIKTKKLSAGFRPVGFLVVPSDSRPDLVTKFSGVLRHLGKKASAQHAGKVSEWGVFEAVGDQTCEVLDDASGELFPVRDGMLVGVSKKGALHGMTEAAIGHWLGLEFTGRKIPIPGKSPMWQVLSVVSEEPYSQ